jgi:hypothetical protein
MNAAVRMGSVRVEGAGAVRFAKRDRQFSSLAEG